MIPKKIHYCWFGDKPFPELTLRCMESWRKYCPGWEVVRWDESNSLPLETAYPRQAYEAGKWAFVSDYVRLKALWEQGGVYLDTDVELTASLDNLLEQEGFCGFESAEKVATCLIACTPGHPLIGRMLEEYESLSFLREDGSLDCTTNVERVTALLKKKGLVPDGTVQTVDGLTVYPPDWFSPKDLTTGKITRTPNTRSIHHFKASWMTRRQRFHTFVAQCIGPAWTKRLKGMRKS